MPELADEIADWIHEVNQRKTVEQPLGWIDGRFHSASRIRHIYNEEHENKLSTQQVAQALATIRDNPEQYPITVTSHVATRDNKHRWQVYQGVFADV